MKFWPAVLQKHRYPLVLVTISLVWLILFEAATQMARQGIVYPDSQSYIVSAENLYLHFRGHNFRPLLMAVLTGVPYLFNGDRADILNFNLAVNVFCWIASVWLVFSIAKNYVSERWAFLSSMLFIGMMGSSALVFHLLTETIYLSMILLAVWLLLRYENQGCYPYLALGLSILLLTMLVRPGGMVFAVIATLFYARDLLARGISRTQSWIAGALVLIAVQCIGMRYQFGNFTLSYIDTVTYYNYLGSKAQAFADGKTYSQENNLRSDDIYPLPGPEQKRLASADFIRQFKSHPEFLALAYADNLLENSKTGSTPIADCKNLHGSKAFFGPELFWISKWQNRIFSVAGILAGSFFLLIGTRVQRIMALFVMTTVFLSGISCSQGDRFHIVTFPVTIVLCAIAVKKITRYAAPPRIG